MKRAAVDRFFGINLGSPSFFALGLYFVFVNFGLFLDTDVPM